MSESNAVISDESRLRTSLPSQYSEMARTIRMETLLMLQHLYYYCNDPGFIDVNFHFSI